MNEEKLHSLQPLNSSRSLLLLVFAWLLALLPADAPASIPRQVFIAPLLALRAAPAAEDDSAPLTLHLDGVHEGGEVRYGFLVRQNPWSKFDPEGLQTYGQARTYLHYAGDGVDFDMNQAAKTPDLVTGVAEVTGASLQFASVLTPGPKGAAVAERETVSILGSAGKKPGFFEKAGAFFENVGGKISGLFKRGENAGQIEGSAAKTRAVQEGEVGLYSDLKGRSVPHDGLDIHEVPSSAAQIAARESELGRKLTDAEKSALRADNPAIAIRSEAHRLTDAYGGKNTPAQIAGDAADRPAAATRGAQDVIRAGQRTGVDLTKQADQLKEMTK